ncbi:MAG: 5'-3' exonuclease H3TH domain-containing protein [Myxococcota bacterium]
MTVLLVDSHSLLFRAHHALPPMNTTAGEPTQAVYGTSVLLLKLLREVRPTGLAFAFDTPTKTFRHQAFAGYKAGRARVDDGLVRQLRRFDDVVTALGAPAHRHPGYEADDVLATLAAQSEADVLVVTGDRDLFQTIDRRVEVLFVGRRGGPHERYDLAAIDRRYPGVSPALLPSVTALVGDPADNLPKVPGIGIKTAVDLVRRYGDVAGVLAHRDALRPRVRAALTDAADQIRQSEVLARLRRDVPVTAPLWAPVAASAPERLAGLFEALEFRSLLPRLAAALHPTA